MPRPCWSRVDALLGQDEIEEGEVLEAGLLVGWALVGFATEGVEVGRLGGGCWSGIGGKDAGERGEDVEQAEGDEENSTIPVKAPTGGWH